MLWLWRTGPHRQELKVEKHGVSISIKCNAKISVEKIELKNNLSIFDENDFHQFLSEFGNIENKIRNRLKQRSDSENDFEFQNKIETIKALKQHTNKMLENSTKRINLFYDI